MKNQEPLLFNDESNQIPLPQDYTPTKPQYFNVNEIYLCKGSQLTGDRIRFFKKICSIFPKAMLYDLQDKAHNQIFFKDNNFIKLHQKGKRTLVFGEHKSSVRFSTECGNTCPNYWHFSPYGYCFYGCKYCYLSGTKSVWHSPTIKIFLNIEEILRNIDIVALKLKEPVAFYLGKLQDGLSLDPLTNYSSIFVPFFASHKYARQIILTKSAEVENLLGQNHNGNTILAWSLNPTAISIRFEENVPKVEERIKAMKKCAEHGYPIRAVVMPIIPVKNWKELYSEFISYLLNEVPIQRLTLGGICSYRNAFHLMEKKIGCSNSISNSINKKSIAEDGRLRYDKEIRIKMYNHIIRVAKMIKPDIELALCLEEHIVWEKVGLTGNFGKCNCVL